MRVAKYSTVLRFLGNGVSIIELLAVLDSRQMPFPIFFLYMLELPTPDRFSSVYDVGEYEVSVTVEGLTFQNGRSECSTADCVHCRRSSRVWDCCLSLAARLGQCCERLRLVSLSRRPPLQRDGSVQYFWDSRAVYRPCIAVELVGSLDAYQRENRQAGDA